MDVVTQSDNELDYENQQLLELLKKRKRRRDKKSSHKKHKHKTSRTSKTSKTESGSDIIPASVSSHQELALPSKPVEPEYRSHQNNFVEHLSKALTPVHVVNSKGVPVQVNPCKRIYWDPKRNWIMIDTRNRDELFKELTNPNLLAIKSRDYKTLKNAYVRQFENYGFEKVKTSVLSACRGMEFKVAFRHPDGYNPLRHNETYQILYEAYDRRKKVKRDETKELEQELQQVRQTEASLRADNKYLQHKLKKVEEKNSQLTQQLIHLQQQFISKMQPQPPAVVEPPPSRSNPFSF